jgi:hypothetical protein
MLVSLFWLLMMAKAVTTPPPPSPPTTPPSLTAQPDTGGYSIQVGNPP